MPLKLALTEKDGVIKDLITMILCFQDLDDLDLDDESDEDPDWKPGDDSD